jgi:hypothetical protein
VIVAVSDTTPLIHLAAIDSLGLLSVVDTLLIPATVRADLDAGGVPDGLADVPHELVAVEEGTVVPDDDLDAGGTAALVIASGTRYFSPTTSTHDAPRRRPTSRSTAPSVSSFSRTLAARSTGRPPSTGCGPSRSTRVCS